MVGLIVGTFILNQPTVKHKIREAIKNLSAHSQQLGERSEIYADFEDAVRSDLQGKIVADLTYVRYGDIDVTLRIRDGRAQLEMTVENVGISDSQMEKTIKGEIALLCSGQVVTLGDTKYRIHYLGTTVPDIPFLTEDPHQRTFLQSVGRLQKFSQNVFVIAPPFEKHQFMIPL